MPIEKEVMEMSIAKIVMILKELPEVIAEFAELIEELKGLIKGDDDEEEETTKEKA